MRSACALLLLILAQAAPADAYPSTQTLLEELRKATLGRSYASISSIHTISSVEVAGIAGRAQEWDDLHGGRFTTDQNAGALSGASGWDGRVAWNQDYAGLVTIDGGSAGRMEAADQAYLDNLRYLRADAGGATAIYAGRRESGGTTYDVLAVTPPDGSEMDLWIGPRSHLIERVTTTIGSTTSTTAMSNYRRVDGITFAFASSTQLSRGETFAQRVLSLELNTDVADRMRVPGQNVHDYSVTSGTTNVPIDIVNSNVYVRGVTIDGHGPYTFVLDSGGDYILAPDVAAALQAKSSGAAFAHVNSIAIGGAVVRNQYMTVSPIAIGLRVSEGLQVDGMLGYQFLARFLTTIDYAGSKLTLTTPSSLPAAAPGAAAMQLFFDRTIPRINVNVNDVTVSTEVDTGNRAGLELSAPFLAMHPAVAALAKTPPGVVGLGVGGPVYARLGRIPLLQIGPYQVANSIASFAIGGGDAFADPLNPASLGGPILRRFTLTFDYAHEQLLLTKNAGFDTPSNYDRSGLFLIDSDGAYTVLSVFAGSPAATAALAQGDVILAINGAPAANESLAALRQLLAGPAGSVVRLHVRGPAGHERDAMLTLRDYV
ncbi:MAG TPA: PDZ domain-containing protein [Candidatus Nitrosotalea sp.]|nr:PDZ domain-containing protein [Candidatus Nitrosotalea sp.]